MRNLFFYIMMACSMTLFITSCETETETIVRENPLDRTSWENTELSLTLEFTSGSEVVLTVPEASGMVGLAYSYEFVADNMTAEMRYPTEEYPDFDALISSGTLILTNLHTGQEYAVFTAQ